ncbi:hypothetical protein IQ277_28045 [Nostocales cyanobacterium LEGE 12452]|nr:hypothetical protein [Nostocales cyanobacterium LEGE 12452]
MKGRNIDKLLLELSNEIEQSNDVDYLMYIFEIFKNGEYEFLNHYYVHRISQQIVNSSISLKQGDFFLAGNMYDEIRSYKFISGVGYFDRISDIRKRQKEGFFVKGVPFLKSGQLSNKRNFDEWVSENYILKIVRGFECVNKKDEKTVFNLLKITETELSILEEGNRPIIVDVSK